MPALVDAWEAGLRVRLGDLDRARDLLDRAERAVHGDPTFPGDHLRTMLGTVRAALHLELGDLPGARHALGRAYAAALQARDLPILALVAVRAAALAEAHGQPREAAYLLGAASRLRGAHDRTDRLAGQLTRRARATLGEEPFAAAYAEGWNLDAKTATTEADPARRPP
jgi:hypothetical protein